MNMERLEMEGTLVGLRQEAAGLRLNIEGFCITGRRLMNTDLVGVDKLEVAAITRNAQNIEEAAVALAVISRRIERLNERMGRG